MDKPRVYEEDGYIHFMLRPEDLMRLRYSEEAKTSFSGFMDKWLERLKSISARFLTPAAQRSRPPVQWIFRSLSI